MDDRTPITNFHQRPSRWDQQAMPQRRVRSRSNLRDQQRGSRYDNLHDDVIEHEIVNNENLNAKYIPPRCKKPPPITVLDISILNLRNKLCLVKDIDQEKLLIRLTQHGIKIFSKNNSEFDIIKKFCIQNNIHYYTHTLHDERRIKICLYGLYKMKVDTLMNELREKHKIKPHEIKMIEPKSRRRHYDEECIYILYFQKKDNVKLECLRQITGIFNIKVNWKYYSTRSHGPTQCSNCQDFGHGTENCHLKPKCIRCGGQHASEKCPHLPITDPGDSSTEKPKIPDEKVQCANCGDKHTANFKGCNYRKQYMNIQLQMKPRSRHTPPPRNSEEIYPSLPKPSSPVGNNSWMHKSPISQPIHTIQHQTSSSNDLLSPLECSQIMSELLCKLPQCKSKEDQIKLIYEISFKYVYGSTN